MHIPRLFQRCLSLALLLLVVHCAAQATTNSASPGPKPEQAEATEEKKKAPATIIEFYTWAGILPKELVDLQAEIKSRKAIENTEKVIKEIAQQLETLQWQVTIAKTTPDLQLLQINNYQLELHQLSNQLTMLAKPLTRNISEVAEWRNQWNSRLEKLKEFREQDHLSIALAIEQQEQLQNTIDTARKLIEQELAPALTLGKQIADLQIQLHTIDSDLQQLDAELRRASTQQTSPSILSKAFYEQINARFFKQTYVNSKRFIVNALDSLRYNQDALVLMLLLLIVLSGMVHLSRTIIKDSSRWHPFATNPVATATFIIATTYNLIGLLPFGLLQDQKFKQFFYLLSVVAMIKLIDRCIHVKWLRRLLRRMAIFLVITVLMIAIDLPQLLILFFAFYVSIVAIVFYLIQLRVKSDTVWEKLARRSWGLLPALIILAGISGYDQFAIYSFSTLLTTVGSVLIIWMLYRMNIGLLELLLMIFPFGLVRDNLRVIVGSLKPVIAWLHGIFLLSVLGVIWNIYPSVDTALEALANTGFTISGLTISPGFILIIVFVFYGAILFSRGIQAVLLQAVLPRYGAKRGVQLSIARLAHYAILTVGFFIMLRVLGFQLDQLTLLGGALGIGIGFGLQAIVTNFASGLILLFERPIKVGDTIQIGTDWGEVKELGLRATTIQTFDNAEIVIPNSDLVTGQVTNWTLAERVVRVKIPVGVAYGTDVSQVLDILRYCAESNPMVLSTPKPVALFRAFGASSLDFELRVWIPDINDIMTVTSDLNESIDYEFAIKKIEIPFLQTDLHIRTVDEKAAEALRGNTTSRLHPPEGEQVD